MQAHETEGGGDRGDEARRQSGEDPGKGRPETPGWSSLTESELRIADLVTEGLTNVQIAEAMFLSRHTVDFHLRQLFRKFGVRSRVQLARLVIERRTESGGS